MRITYFLLKNGWMSKNYLKMYDFNVCVVYCVRTLCWGIQTRVLVKSAPKLRATCSLYTTLISNAVVFVTSCSAGSCCPCHPRQIFSPCSCHGLSYLHFQCHHGLRVRNFCALFYNLSRLRLRAVSFLYHTPCRVFSI